MAIPAQGASGEPLFFLAHMALLTCGAACTCPVNEPRDPTNADAHQFKGEVASAVTTGFDGYHNTAFATEIHRPAHVHNNGRQQPSGEEQLIAAV